MLTAVASRRPADQLGPAVHDHVDLSSLEIFKSAPEMAESGCADVIIETIGGTDLALDTTLAALRSGKSVVTANKAMLALHGGEMVEVAEQNGVSIGWEAAVGGGIPCIRAVREGLSANHVGYAAGILNGTCNFILTTMKEQGRPFDDVLAEAQALGYAETPPDLDVDGFDTAHKIALVAALASGSRPSFESVYVEGIRSIGAEDVTAADSMGYSIKLLGIVSPTDSGGVLQRVHPALIPKETALGSTHGVLNGLLTDSDMVGPTFLQGRGAGSEATASAVVADVVDLARQSQVPTFGVPWALMESMTPAGMDEREGRYFLRFAHASGDQTQTALQGEGIPIELMQSSYNDTEEAGCAVITGNVKEPAMLSALDSIGKGSEVLCHQQLIRVEGPW